MGRLTSYVLSTSGAATPVDGEISVVMLLIAWSKLRCHNFATGEMDLDDDPCRAAPIDSPFCCNTLAETLKANSTLGASTATVGLFPVIIRASIENVFVL